MNKKKLTTQEDYDVLLKKIRNIFIQKSFDYSGEIPMKDLREVADLGIEPWLGVIIRMVHKFGRLKQLAKNEKVKDRYLKIEDTLIDIANYCLITILLLKENMAEIKFYECTAMCNLPTKFGMWKLRVYKNRITNEEHILLTHPLIDVNKPVVLRIHSSCITGDIFTALNCDCREQLDKAMKIIQKEKGALAYLFQEGRGIGLTNKIKAYAFKEIGYNTFEANLALGLPEDNRNYDVVVEMLKDVGIKSVILLSANPKKIETLKKGGIQVIQKKIKIKENKFNSKYIKTQRERYSHLGKFRK